MSGVYGRGHMGMRIILEIPVGELKDAIRFTGATTESEAVVRAVAEFNRLSRMTELTRFSGTCGDLITPEELQTTRRATDHE